MARFKLAILDDYANLALASADWSDVAKDADIHVFSHPIAEGARSETLCQFDVICTLRERTAFPRALFADLSSLKLLTAIGSTSNIDVSAATELGIAVWRCDFADAGGSAGPSSTAEFAWGLLIATVRGLAHEARRVREGQWQGSAGPRLAGRTLGLVGLGRVGRKMAEYARAFDMKVIAWSENLTDEAAAEAGALRVTKEELFRQADVVSVHLKLSERTVGLITSLELGLMGENSFLINTSRGAIVRESDLILALEQHVIAGAGLDVFEQEPLTPNHPFRSLTSVTATPHMAFASRERLGAAYVATAQAVSEYLARKQFVANNS